jgi:hypothetical protein
LAVKAQSIEELIQIRHKAEQGDASAQNNLGLMYDNGQGVTQNSRRGRMVAHNMKRSLNGKSGGFAIDFQHRSFRHINFLKEGLYED